MTAAVITAALFFCNITPFKNAEKDSLPCLDNTNKFILFWEKYIIYNYHQFFSFLKISVGANQTSGSVWPCRKVFCSYGRENSKKETPKLVTICDCDENSASNLVTLGDLCE